MLHDPTPWHLENCSCRDCDPDRISGRDFFLLTIGGAGLSLAVAFAVDPAGAAAALLATVGIV